MQLKWLGCILFLGFAVAYCVYDARRLQETARRLSAWVDLLTHVRGQISCFGTPLGQILDGTDADTLALIVPSADMKQQGLGAICRASAPTLPSESGRLLEALSDEIGTIWRQEQLERLNYYIAALEKEQAAFCTSLPARIRLKSTLSLCGALAMILLIW